MLAKIQHSIDGTIKMLFKLSDGQLVETVALVFRKKYTLCLSSQVGCRFNCVFCFTGKQKLQRSLTAKEIIDQYLAAWNYLKENKKTIATANIVFMGQGEPLDNFEAIKESILYFMQTDGIKLGPRQITISTAGYLPGLKRFLELPPINLAISLHCADSVKRSQIMPINKKYPIEDIINVVKNFPLAKKQYIAFEYLLIKNFNDQIDDAYGLFGLIKELKAIVNLIPFNPYPGTLFERSSKDEVDEFKQWLVKLRLRTMIRASRGLDIMAACGQLRSPDHR
ncbi:MAG: 23S rRNA (adenine(2503)-C(2))-methyltransferase [Bdellovibrionales bacterium RIFOXYB1_FULL_37_110]|nr:MAG: 23S rRNA (adenine(2503)-C(2))-methyltransferase [Bdellovibrionales bacterium RIFOXYC1_FULL_37_79]OFZ57968.1 MAG: 23S rRNA (adenine(2503)-C(2))-methyltransferase [Bdellovibrionales bacterium RIFOXYB1_FULL_37_110]OFZ63105.1 MAG: 23S rRNA (adenine(2503)-C(2))-methyltransferase [Bdellovibrionales bacterium RIFOXYD1_FULL_36_51]OFZ63571.1 MAG: 23S rRNA (adenine(2503)-C(2))-methyltransferase [Bdellovibrionales bacterium RIFOXYB2_FULL_36_6]